MKSLVFGTALVLAASITVPLAQQAQPPSNEPAHKIYVMTGCLEPGTTSGTTFKLTGAAPIGQAAPARIGPAAASRSDMVYELQPVASIGEQGISRERLQTHLGKRVEVTVRPVEVSQEAPPSTRTTDVAKPEEAVPQRYTVVKINQLSESCG
jgi:hypothetical protein